MTMDVGLIITAVNNATAPLKQLDNSLKQVGETSQVTANRLKAIEVVITGILLSKAIELGKAFVELESTMENLQARAGAWSGGMQQGNAVIDEFREKLGAAGIPMENLVNAYVRLRTAGVGMDQAKNTVENLVNAIAAVGGTDLASKLDGAATAFQRFASKGMTSQRELNAIINSTGLTVKDLADNMGKSGEKEQKFWDDLASHSVKAQALLDAFNAAAQKKFKDFASLLNDTVGGALSQFKMDFEHAMEGVGGQTNISAYLVAGIQSLDKWIVQLIHDIKPEDIEFFFNLFADAVPQLKAVGELVYLVTRSLLTFADAGLQIMNLLPAEATEFGIVGYFIAGKKGAAIGAFLGTVFGIADRGIRSLGDSVDRFMIDHNIAKAFFTQDLKNNQQTTMAALGNAMGAAGNFNAKSPFAAGMSADMKKLIADIEAGQAKLAAMKLGAQGNLFPHGDDTGMQKIADEIERIRQGAKDLIATLSGKDYLLQMKNSGDELGATIQGLINEQTGYNKQIDDELLKIKQSKMGDAEKVDLKKQLLALEDKYAADIQIAIDKATILNALKENELRLQNQINQAQVQEDIRKVDLSNTASTSPMQAMFQGTSAGQFVEQVRQQTFALNQSISQYREAINKLNQQIQQKPAMAAEYQQTINMYEELIKKTQDAVEHLTAESALETDFFKELGQTIETDVGSAINGLIQGTMTWAQAGRKLFGDLVELALKYIEKLLLIKLMESSMGGAGGGLGSLLGGLFADGGVFKGQVTPFANGGIVAGPTLFGLAGEAGTEAIMPLTRIGGQLGVRAVGGGGNTYQITIQAIDTQTGMQFVGKHIQHIEAGLNQSKNMNSRAGHF